MEYKTIKNMEGLQGMALSGRICFNSINHNYFYLILILFII